MWNPKGEELETLKLDWNRLKGTPGGAEIVAQLHGKTVAEVLEAAAAFDRPAPPQGKKAVDPCAPERARVLALADGTLTARQVAERTGVEMRRVYDIVRRGKGRLNHDRRGGRRAERIAENPEKMAVLRRIRAGEKPGAVAKELGLSKNTVRGWMRRYEEQEGFV